MGRVMYIKQDTIFHRYSNQNLFKNIFPSHLKTTSLHDILNGYNGVTTILKIYLSHNSQKMFNDKLRSAKFIHFRRVFASEIEAKQPHPLFYFTCKLAWIEWFLYVQLLLQLLGTLLTTNNSIVKYGVKPIFQALRQTETNSIMCLAQMKRSFQVRFTIKVKCSCKQAI